MPDSARVGQFVRSPETDEALDNVLQALVKHGFTLPGESARGNRSALADALVQAAIDHEIRIRIDKEPHEHKWGAWQNDVAGAVRECACGETDFRPEG